MKPTTPMSWGTSSFTLSRVSREGGVENIKGTMRSLGLLRQSKASKVIISFSIVCLYIIFIQTRCFLLKIIACF